MVRSKLIESLAARNPDLSASEAEAVVAAFFETITGQLVANGRVELRGFGAFSTRSRNPRAGRNPRTGEPVDVAAKRVSFFKPGKEMKERVNR